ncbi:transferase [Zychaea mexicana]|uniref:transferase n=1 Tax=Zychaea mexicana TaxID=64656 RepID=UPI0022FEF58E|nr:transferase [Zychaea mexicana]KAI9499139.1 transferase [Zychaea mexicana]
MPVPEQTTTTTTTIIHASDKHNRQPLPSRIFLSGLDCYNFPSEICVQWLFHSAPESIQDAVFRLKSALSEALELYPPMTGTICKDANDDLYISLENRNRPGTPFIFEIKDTPYDNDASALQPRDFRVLLPVGSNTFIVKVVQFSCGTIGVASSLHHQIADPRGYMDFHATWTQLARGELVDLKRIPYDWSRIPGRFFPPPSDGEPISPPPGIMIVSPKVDSTSNRFGIPSVATKWKMSKSSLIQLKADLSPTPSSATDKWISTGDALTSLIFGAITRARENGNVARVEGRSSVESQIESIMVPGDGRFRIPPGNTEGSYFGNLNINCNYTVTRADLLSPTLEAARRVALAIRDQLECQLSTEAIANQLAFFENRKTSKSSERISTTADVFLSNWCCFDLQGPNYDFGFGKPFKATSGIDGRAVPGFVLLMQTHEFGEVFLWIGVEREGGEELKADLLLNKYATLVQ